MKKTKYLAGLLTTITFASIPFSVNGYPIHQNVVDNYGQIEYFGPIGQSFVAEDSNISASIWISEYNQQVAPSDYEISYYLYEGIGSSSSLVGSGVFSELSDNYLGWATFDLSSYFLAIGNTYSLMIDNDNARWGFGFAESDLYSEGQLILSNDTYQVFPDFEFYDLTFKIDPVSVPEPPSFLLILMGLAGAFANKYRKVKAS